MPFHEVTDPGLGWMLVIQISDTFGSENSLDLGAYGTFIEWMSS